MVIRAPAIPINCDEAAEIRGPGASDCPHRIPAPTAAWDSLRPFPKEAPRPACASRSIIILIGPIVCEGAGADFLGYNYPVNYLNGL
jgi:hypothetical protein